ncbi:Chloride channel protein [Arcticibacter svalbardensis MN12-7]|uniref:Chloride channel protein n=1 Tax=Arcticibacter svalbardensis MN12-7 TaxID=1150600 RepID=R9GUW3_9SPHI|nr:voltage-gated chloride channel family protein [Arcticibacter svalbardensis]EOR95483.1 Chloride channel protein [Arcticibacter svalbardensis MN12-7]
MTTITSISLKEHFAILKHLVRWTLFVVPIALIIGSIVALFLWLLTTAIHFRFEHKWILFLLPLAGLLIHFIYQYFGKSSEKGNNLIMEEIHQEGAGVPIRMTPIILITTVVTHLFGGSAGREGTAVQIGGSIAALFGRWFKLKGMDMRMILTAGVAAGFGAVFGTPVTGAIFAMEVLTIGRIQYDALIPALIGAVVGDMTVGAWHVSHMHYYIGALPDSPYLLSNIIRPDLLLMGKVIIASAVFGLASFLFAGMVNEIKTICLNVFKFKWMIPVFGGLVIIGLTILMGKPDYLSLGVDAEYPGSITLSSAFQAGGSDTWSWLWKTIYTSITLGTGFKGGEVTPLFYIGATLGNTLSGILHAPVSLFAALGFIAVFAGATNTPLACTFMGVELFGGQHALLFAIACFTAYIFSGHSGIYSSQRIAVPKVFGDYFSNELSLTEATKRRGYMYRKLAKYHLFRKKNKDGNND